MLRKFSAQEKGWIMYDWANSAFSAIVSATLLPIFFGLLSSRAGVDEVTSLAYWGNATSVGTLVCAVLAPFLGALGDFPGYKKRLFACFVVLGVLGTALLAVTGSWKVLLGFYIVANIGFHGSGLFYDSFLNDVTTPDRMDMVSTYGYGMGYIGGSTIPLVIALAMLQFGEGIGITQEFTLRFSFVMTAVWWIAFTWPMLRDVKQLHSVPRERAVVRQTLRNIGRTAGQIMKHRGLLWFLIAYFFYIDGVGTIISMATIFGASVGLPGTNMVFVLMVVQLVAFPCAILYGILAKKVGARTMILVGIGTYLVVCVVGLFLKTMTDFLILGALVGTAQGGIQALSRSYFGKLVPNERASEFFGFFDVFGKFSAVLGPALFALVATLTGRPHPGVAAVAAMFIIGGAIFLFLVPKEQQRAA